MRIKLNYHLIPITQLPHCFVPCKHNSVVFYTHIQNILRRWNMTIKDTVTLCLHWKWHKPKFSNSVNEVTYCISGCVHKRSVFTCYLTYQHGLWDQKFVFDALQTFLPIYLIYPFWSILWAASVRKRHLYWNYSEFFTFRLCDTLPLCLYGQRCVLPWQQFDMMG